MAKQIKNEITKSIDLIEKANIYHFLAKNHLSRSIRVGNRLKLEWYMQFIPVDMVVATFGTSKKCIILLDYKLGDLMDFMSNHERVVN